MPSQRCFVFSFALACPACTACAGSIEAVSSLLCAVDDRQLDVEPLLTEISACPSQQDPLSVGGLATGTYSEKSPSVGPWLLPHGGAPAILYTTHRHFWWLVDHGGMGSPTYPPTEEEIDSSKVAVRNRNRSRQSGSRSFIPIAVSLRQLGVGCFFSLQLRDRLFPLSAAACRSSVQFSSVRFNLQTDG